MANSPNKPSFKASDYPSNGLGSQDSLQRFFGDLGSFTSLASDSLFALALDQNFNGEVKTITIQTPVTDWVNIQPFGTAGATIAFTSGTTAFSSTDDIPRVRKEADRGLVFIEGLITNAATGNNYFTLPAVYQSAYSVNFATAVATGGVEGYGRLRIIGSVGGATAGNVGIVGPNAPTTWGSICCCFTAGDRNPAPYSCFPIQVNCQTKNPAYVWLLKVTEVTTTGGVQTPFAPGGIHWQNNNTNTGSSGGIKILNIPGLLLNRKYQVTLAIQGSGT